MSTTAPDFGRCTCHSVREFSGGHFGSLAMLGVQCGPCEAANDWYQQEEEWAALSDAERTRIEIAGRWFTATHRWGRYDRRPGSPVHTYTDAWGHVTTEPPF